MPNTHPNQTPHHDVAMPWASGFVVLGLVLGIALVLRIFLY